MTTSDQQTNDPAVPDLSDGVEFVGQEKPEPIDDPSTGENGAAPKKADNTDMEQYGIDVID